MVSDIVNAKDKPNTKRKMLKYVYYPKCTTPTKTSQNFFNGTTSIKDMIVDMKPKDWVPEYNEYLAFGFGPWNATLLPGSDETDHAVDVFCQFEWSMKLYYSCFKRDSVTH